MTAALDCYIIHLLLLEPYTADDQLVKCKWSDACLASCATKKLRRARLLLWVISFHYVGVFARGPASPFSLQKLNERRR